LFHLWVAFPPGDEIKAESPQIVGVFFVIGAFMLGLMGYIPTYISAFLAFLVTFLQSSKQRQSSLQWLTEKAFKRTNLKPKPMLYAGVTLFVIVLFIVQQFVDSMMQECDYVTDGFILLILSFLWLTKPGHTRRQDYVEYLCIIFCIKFTYFLDRERSMNFEVEPVLSELRTKLAGENIALVMLPLVLMVPLELFVSVEHRLGMIHIIKGFCLTASLFLYQVHASKDPFDGRDPDTVKLNKKIATMAEH
jgi:hypothetical protein